MNTNSSPKATKSVYVGDHVANLAAQPHVIINSIGAISELHNIPLWISLNPDYTSPKFYRDLFWEVEPFGEYLYFLAGDFTKNEKGLLNFTSPSTLVLAEVNFEDDVIDAGQSDSDYEQSIAEQRPDIIDIFIKLNVGDLIDKVPHSSYSYDDKVLFVSLNKLLPENSSGYSRMIVNKPHKVTNIPSISFVYDEFRPAQNADEYPRYTKIFINTKDRNLKISNLVKVFCNLVSQYRNMPYLSLSGTTRE